MRLRVAALAAALLGLLWPLGAGAATRHLDYLYMDASEGGGSGGHAALAVGDRVFHFEHRSPGLIVLAREPRDVVEHRYRVHHNRSILVSRIPVSEETYAAVADELARRYVVQHQHLADHEAAVDDRRLLEAVRARRRGEDQASVRVVGAGFFVDRVADSPAARDGVDGGDTVPLDGEAPDRASGDVAPALLRLRARVTAGAGDALAQAIRRVRIDLATLLPEAVVGAPVSLASDELSTRGYGVAARHRDLAQLGAALEVLTSARPLRPGVLVRPSAARLESGDAELIDRLSATLEASLARLVSSQRPDRGFALLLGMARLVALDESRQSGHWVILDTRPEPSATSSHATAMRHERAGVPAASVRALHARTRADLDAARTHLARAAGPAAFPELAFAAVEVVGNRLAETERAIALGRDARPTWSSRLPSRPASVPIPDLAELDDPSLDRAIALAALREATLAAELERLYGYRLVTRNCVTEIFRTIDAALARDLVARDPTLRGDRLAARVRAASVEQLGGYVEPVGRLNFIPAVSSANVRDGYAVSATVELPSYRKAEVDRMYAREHPLVVFARESNTLTSTLYAAPADDSAFLLFTDDAVAARPLFGAINVVAGLGVAAAGVATAPVDGGARLIAGLRGALFSLPELVFFNIRKGSFPDRGREHRIAPARSGGD